MRSSLRRSRGGGGGVASAEPGPRMVLIHSGLAFALAFLITLFVHELAHGLAALSLGLRPVVHATYESDVATTPGKQTAIALAGPVASALVGAVLLAVPSWGHGIARLLQVWLGLLGMATFCGYLLTAPFLSSGDIGLALALQHAPTAVAWLVALVGAVGIVGLGALAARGFVPLAGSGPDRTPLLRALGLMGWLAGAVLTFVAIFPPQYVSIVFAIVFTGVFTMFVRFFSTRVPSARATRFTARSPVPTAVALLLVAGLLRLVVDPGIHL